MTSNTEISFDNFTAFLSVLGSEVVAKEEPTPFLKREDVLRVYSGRRGCACGCRGTYYVGKADAAHEDASGSTVSDAQVTKIVGTINASSRTARRHAEGDIVFFETEKRLFIAYLRAGKTAMSFAVEAES